MDRITSLFDLVNKARSNKDYLEVLVATALRYGAGKDSVESVDKIDEYLSALAKSDEGCHSIIYEANYQRECKFPEPIKVKVSSINREIYNRLVFDHQNDFLMSIDDSESFVEE